MNALELSAEDFNRLAANIVDLCAGYLGTLNERSTFPQTTGEESQRLFDLDLPERGMGDQAFAALTDVIGKSRAQNGRFFGYVQGWGEPIAALGDLLGSILNQNITAWRSSPRPAGFSSGVLSVAFGQMLHRTFHALGSTTQAHPALGLRLDGAIFPV